MQIPDPATRATIAALAGRFAFDGVLETVEELPGGHINSTYRLTHVLADGSRARHVLQRINEKVFEDPLAVMGNIERVTRHIKAKRSRSGEQRVGRTLELLTARDGRCWVADAGGGIWRGYNHIEGCRAREVVENPRQAHAAARAFGDFQALVSDLPAAELVETIPHFHDTRRRYERLMEVAAADPCGRLAAVTRETDFIRAREGLAGRLLDLRDEGVLPVRITHNDTKFNNVMLDEATDEAVCVIDLDTVMPGLAPHDFGDLVRSAANAAAEDERDLDKVAVRMDLFEGLVEGYLAAAGDFLTGAEVANLVFSAKLIALEAGIRFLTDHLGGDTYFRTCREGQNLDRCRVHLRLVERIEEQEPAMNRVVERGWRVRGPMSRGC